MVAANRFGAPAVGEGDHQRLTAEETDAASGSLRGPKMARTVNDAANTHTNGAQPVKMAMIETVTVMAATMRAVRASTTAGHELDRRARVVSIGLRRYRNSDLFGQE